MIGPAHCLEGLDDLQLSEAIRADFLGGNAERIFAVRVGAL